MFLFWLFGFVAYVLGRAFYAGLHAKSLFYREAKRYGETGRQLDEDKIWVYTCSTVIVSLSWPLSLPVIGVFMLGKKLNKKEA